MSYTIYIHINKINGKTYIGQTSQNVNQRWRNGRGYENNTLFDRAIKKYGWDNFEHKILHTGLTKDEANKMEIEMISLYGSNNPNNGYNLTIGGTGSNGYSHTEEAKRKISKSQTGRIQTEECKKRISESLKGENSPWYGKTFTDEHRKKLSEAHIGQVSAMGMLGKKHSKETKRRMSEMRMGHETSMETRRKIGEANSKKVRCIETGIVYSGLPEASKETGCPKSGISMCCNGKQKSSKGYHWEYI